MEQHLIHIVVLDTATSQGWKSSKNQMNTEKDGGEGEEEEEEKGSKGKKSTGEQWRGETEIFCY